MHLAVQLDRTSPINDMQVSEQCSMLWACRALGLRAHDAAQVCRRSGMNSRSLHETALRSCDVEPNLPKKYPPVEHNPGWHKLAGPWKPAPY